MLIPLLVFIALYLIITLLTYAGLHTKPVSTQNLKPFVSVVVVARNEEQTIAACIESLIQLNYPKERLEIILVNDRSTDRTAEIITGFVNRHAHIKQITIDKDPIGHTGKTNGLIHGVNASKGDYLFFTDADCIVPSNWTRSALNGYANSTGLQGGFLILDRPDENASLFARMQSLDWLFLATIGLGWSNWGLPLSIFGNNFSIRRDAYLKAGGFETAGKHITEDYCLMRTMNDATSYHTRLLLDPQNTVHTRPSKTLAEFFHQRKRWAAGARDRGFLSLFILSTAFFTHLALILALVSGHTWTALVGFFVKSLCDTMLLNSTLKKLKRTDLFKFIIPFEFYCILYTVLLSPVFFFSKRIKWKSIDYLLKK